MFSCKCLTQHCTWHSCHNYAILAFHFKQTTQVSLLFQATAMEEGNRCQHSPVSQYKLAFARGVSSYADYDP